MHVYMRDKHAHNIKGMNAYTYKQVYRRKHNAYEASV